MVLMYLTHMCRKLHTAIHSGIFKTVRLRCSASDSDSPNGLVTSRSAKKKASEIAALALLAFSATVLVVVYAIPIKAARECSLGLLHLADAARSRGAESQPMVLSRSEINIVDSSMEGYPFVTASELLGFDWSCHMGAAVLVYRDHWNSVMRGVVRIQHVGSHVLSWVSGGVMKVWHFIQAQKLHYYESADIASDSPADIFQIKWFLEELIRHNGFTVVQVERFDPCSIASLETFGCRSRSILRGVCGVSGCVGRLNGPSCSSLRKAENALGNVCIQTNYYKSQQGQDGIYPHRTPIGPRIHEQWRLTIATGLTMLGLILGVSGLWFMYSAGRVEHISVFCVLKMLLAAPLVFAIIPITHASLDLLYFGQVYLEHIL